MNIKIEDSHENNVFAFNEKGESKHISLVKKGRKGYYCMGCNAEMEARKGDIRSHYYAHVPTDVKIERKCTYSDETYRHKLAKEILQRIKQIKVPTLYKYPPKGINGKPHKIRDSWTVFADEVKIERQFYEDKSGEIRYGQNIDFEKSKEKNLLIRPDVAFFKGNVPILLIEIVATHKIDAAKLSKIKRLGIDTIQITVPKDSPQEIENNFYRTHRIQWIYNYEQETSLYIPVSQSDQEGIPFSDEFQNKLFKAVESFSCRSSQINNLIRGIRKCLESEQYRRIKQELRSEVQRVEVNTERNKLRLQEIQTGHKREIEKSFELQGKSLEEEERRFDKEEEEFENYFGDLETRYFNKRKELEYAQASYRSGIESQIEDIEGNMDKSGSDSRSYEERRESLRKDEEYESKYFKDIKDRIGKEQRKTTESIQYIETTRMGLPSEIGESERKIQRNFGEEEIELRRNFEEKEVRLRSEFEGYRRANVKAIQNRDSNGTSRIRRRVYDAIEAGEILKNISQGRSRIKTYEFIKKLLDTGDYKNRLY
jgi:hypothetical protein